MAHTDGQIKVSQCHFFWKLVDKTQIIDVNLLNIELKIWSWKYQSSHLSEPFYFIHFSVRHPVKVLRNSKNNSWEVLGGLLADSIWTSYLRIHKTYQVETVQDFLIKTSNAFIENKHFFSLNNDIRLRDHSSITLSCFWLS